MSTEPVANYTSPQQQDPYPNYPTYPSQHTAYHSEFISPSVTPAPHSDPRSSSTPPPPVPPLTDPNGKGNGGNYYSPPTGWDNTHWCTTSIQPPPMAPPVIPPVYSPGHVQQPFQPYDPEKAETGNTAGGAGKGKFLTIFGKQYKKKTVIILAIVFVLALIFIIGLGAGLGGKSKKKKTGNSKLNGLGGYTGGSNDITDTDTTYTPPDDDTGLTFPCGDCSCATTAEEIANCAIQTGLDNAGDYV